MEKFLCAVAVKEWLCPGVHHFLIFIPCLCLETVDCDTTLAGCHQRCQTSEAVGLVLILLLLKVQPSALGGTDCRIQLLFFLLPYSSIHPSIHSLHSLWLGYIVQAVLCISKYIHSFIVRLLGLPPTPIEMLFFSSPKYQPYKLLWLRSIDSSIFVSIAPTILCSRYISFYLNGLSYFSSDTQKSTNIFSSQNKLLQ